MKLVFIRHGDPDYEHNTLTEQGFKEIEALANYYKDFEFKDAYCSPLARAELTAKAFLRPHSKEAIICDWLEEFSHKVIVPYQEDRVQNWDFLPSFFTKQEEFYHDDKYLDTEIMKSANMEEHYQKVVNSFDELLKTHNYIREGKYYRVEKSSKDTLVFICHLGITCVIMSHLMGIPYVLLTQYFASAPTGVTTLVTEEREEGIAQFRCLEYGNVNHLLKANLKPSFSGRFCETFDSDERH